MGMPDLAQCLSPCFLHWGSLQNLGSFVKKTLLHLVFSWNCSKDFSFVEFMLGFCWSISQNILKLSTHESFLLDHEHCEVGTVQYFSLVLSSSCNTCCTVMLSQPVSRLGKPILSQLWSSGEGKKNCFFGHLLVYWVPALVLYHLTLKKHCWTNGTSIFTERKTQTLK